MTDPLDQAPTGASNANPQPFSFFAAEAAEPLLARRPADDLSGAWLQELTDDPAGRPVAAWSDITEMRAAHAIRRVLDQGTERLPYRVTERLARARQQALAVVLDTAEPIRTSRPPLPETGASISFRWQLGALAVSAMLLAGVFVLVDTMKEDQSVEDLAEVDSALLTDDLPLDAYVDRGFSVYLVNTRLPQTQPVSFNSSR